MGVPIQPMADYVVVVTEEVKTKSASGILLPEAAQEKTKTAKVVAVGAGVTGVKVGDQVLYKNEYEAVHTKVGSHDYVIVYFKNIIATVK
jgi:chaperonin GroES